MSNALIYAVGIGWLLLLTVLTSVGMIPGGMLILLAAAGIALLVFILVRHLRTQKENLIAALDRELHLILEKHATFSPSRTFVSPDRETMIALDKQQQLLLLTTIKRKNTKVLSPTANHYDYETHILPFHSLLQSAMLQNGVPIDQKIRNVQITNVLPGGMPTDNPPIGESTTLSLSPQDHAAALQLHVMTDQPSLPSCSITYHQEPLGEHPSETPAYQELQQWHDLLSNMIDEADMKERTIQTEWMKNKGRTSSTYNVTDEFRKMRDLLKEYIRLSEA
ncbi:hypothetical protein [Alkalicoccus chagannorensis]|uniref:hypothetical protein n=1 Tax=Alkalicoccus chagannorensis TaxID=427072 RepID=UPI0003F5DDA0|nr:hypothetical protein [Alkalicoccus chagannorensis]